MSWSYSGDPSNSDLDQVRFLIGDTDTDNQLISDEEITWALTQGGIYFASSLCARAISATFASQADKTVDDLKISYSQKSKQYNDLADRLSATDAHKSLGIFAGGISVSGKALVNADTDRIQPSFSKGMNDIVKTSDDDLTGEC